MRAMKRYRVGSVEQAFTGYQALPESKTEWWGVLGVPPDASFDTIKAAYRKKALEYHPDQKGSHKQMAELNRAWEEARTARPWNLL